MITQNFSNYWAFNLQVITIQQLMKDISKTYSKFEKRYFDGISEFQVIIYCPMTITQHLESLIFYGIAKILIDPVGLKIKALVGLVKF